ncbi:hypothetical protein BH24ACT23_BH24ACT23_06290 [soil metagenome]
MRSSSSLLAEQSTEAVPHVMRRRFIEALRRAEIIALLNAATNPDDLALDLAEELSEAFDAEVVLVIRTEPGASPWRILASVGAPGIDTDALKSWGTCLEAARGGPAIKERGGNLAGVGGRSALLTGGPIGDASGALVIAAIRVYDQEFTDPERALLDAVGLNAMHALQRFWAQEKSSRLLTELRETMLGTAAALANTLDARDDYTGGHAREIAELAVSVGERVGMAPDELDQLRLGAIFHDIGKIAVPDEVLRKPGPLNDEERQLMRRHTIIGEQILAPVPRMLEVRAMVRASHERWDGTGYPDAITGEAIPLGARIIAVVDAWHAMTTTRPYREAMDESEAEGELRDNAGTQFDPAIVSVFLGQG